MRNRGRVTQPETAFNLAACLLAASEAIEKGDLRTAFKGLSLAIKLEPKNAQLHLALGTVFQGAGQFSEAERAFNEALRLAPKLSQALFALGKLKSAEEKAEEAESFLRLALEGDEDNLEVRIFLARVLSDQNRFEEALAELNAVAAAHPKEVAPLASLGTRLYEIGRFDEARDCFAKAIDLDPNQGFAYWGLVQGQRLSESDGHLVAAMESVLARQTLSEVQKMHLLFALGKAHDDLMKFEKAMAYFTAANRIADKAMTRTRGFPKEHYVRLFDLTRRVFTRETIESRRTEYSSNPTPIFIVGMLRSGTTLVEQILSTHPDVAAGGEISHWLGESAACLNVDRQEFDFNRAIASRKRYEKLLREVSPTARFVTDKVPGNYRALGLLKILYPNAKIVHCTRHPVDTCLSIYATPFRFPPDYSSDPEKLVFTYRQYRDLMRQWRTVLGDQDLIEVDYKELVEDRETVTRRLAEFCDLEWNEAFLHPEKNSRPVTTASVWQARQPIYRSSLERWRQYEPWLGEFRQLLDDPGQE